MQFRQSENEVPGTKQIRAELKKLCESRGGRPGLPSLISLRFLWTYNTGHWQAADRYKASNTYTKSNSEKDTEQQQKTARKTATNNEDKKT